MVHIYSVAVHNSRVRRAVEGGAHCLGMADSWAFNNFIDVEAGSEDQALEKIQLRLPPREGYVVDSIELRHNFGWNKYQS